MIRFFAAVFGTAFICMVGGMYVMPNLILGAVQENVVGAWEEAGVDTSSCKGSVPSLGIGARKCIEGSMRSIAEQINEAEDERTRYEPARD